MLRGIAARTGSGGLLNRLRPVTKWPMKSGVAGVWESRQNVGQRWGKRCHGHLHKPKEGEELHVTFILKDGVQKTFEVSEGDSLLDIAQGHNLDMEGACGGSCACSTCHVIVDPDYYDALEAPDDDENDMLDLAYGLTETSRLGCCIKMNKDIDGIRVALPAMTRNVSSSDFD